jgi:hypothetical protein
MKPNLFLLFILLLALPACMPTAAEPTPIIGAPTLIVSTGEVDTATGQ